jgi:hypothetical protein
MFPFCQFFTLVEWLRAIEISGSMQLVERSVRASLGGTARRSTFGVPVRPSRTRGGRAGIDPLQSRENVGEVERSSTSPARHHRTATWTASQSTT